jgi:quaternary ammonium compound-resistance protein SugE
MSSWIYLLIAGVFEIVWATSMKYSEGMSRLFPTILMYAAGLPASGSRARPSSTSPSAPPMRSGPASAQSEPPC